MRTSAALLLTVHGFGLLGLLMPWSRPWFEAATPLSLLLSAALLLYFHQDWRSAFLAFVAVAVLTGFLIEVAGVQTQAIFGAYTYQGSLGWKVLEVPLVIGVNWLMLVYAAGALWAPLRLHFLLKSLGAAALMTGMDYLIEPLAIAHHYWAWTEGAIPWQNYLGWFAVSFALQIVFYTLPFRKENPLAKYIIGIQAAFFMLWKVGYHWLAQTF